MSKVFEIAFKLGGELTSSFKSAFNEANSTMSILSAAAAAIGGTAAFTAVAGQVMEMEDSLVKLSAQTGIYGEDMKELESIAKNVFKQGHGESFDDVTTALMQVKNHMHNLDAGELERVTGNAMMLANTFDAEVNEVTRAANNLMTNFGIDSEKAFDMMAKGAQNGLNFSNEMFDNLSEYSPLWADMGYSAEQMFGILEVGAKNGVYNLDYLNDVMKEFQIRATDGSKSTTDAVATLGPEVQKVWEAFSNGEATVAEMSQVAVAELAKIDDKVKQNELGVAFFGTKWEDLGGDVVLSMLSAGQAMTDFEGSMQKINEVRFDTVGAALKGIGRTLLTDLVHPIGDMVLPYLNDFANYLSDNLPTAIEKGKDVIKEYGPIALAVGGAFLTYKGVMQGVSTYQKAFNMVQTLTPKLLYAQRTAMLAYTFAGGGARGMITALRSGMVALNLTMLANPFVLAAVAIVALGAAFYGLYQKSEEFRTAVAPLIEMVKTEFVAMGQQVVGAFQQFVPMIATFAASVVPVIINLATMIIPLILQVVQMVFPAVLAIIQAVLPVVITLISTVVTTILTLAQTVLPLVLTVISTVFPVILSVVQMVIPIISTILQSLVMIIQSVLVPAINGILAIVQFVFPYVQMIIQNALAIVNGLIQAAMALLKGDWDDAWNAIKTTAETIMNNIISFFSGINLFEVGRSIITGLINGIKSMGGAIVGAISNLIPEPIRGAAGKLLGKLPGFATGGIVASPTLAWVGEGGDTESIIPWNNSQRSKDLWIQTGQALGMFNKNNEMDSMQQQTNALYQSGALDNIHKQSIMLNQSGAMDNMQQQIALKTQQNNSSTPITPAQIASTSNSSNSSIQISYAPVYQVSKSEDLPLVQAHAEKDKDDLYARLEEITRNERRLAFE